MITYLSTASKHIEDFDAALEAQRSASFLTRSFATLGILRGRRLSGVDSFHVTPIGAIFILQWPSPTSVSTHNANRKQVFILLSLHGEHHFSQIPTYIAINTQIRS